MKEHTHSHGLNTIKVTENDAYNTGREVYGVTSVERISENAKPSCK